MSRGLAAIVPSGGPIAVVAKQLGGSGGAGGGASGGSAALGAVGAGGTASSAGIAIGANHVVALIAAAVATGGAIEIQPTSASAPPAKHPASRASSSRPALPIPAVPGQVELVVDTPSGQIVVVPAASAAVPTAVAAPARSAS